MGVEAVRDVKTIRTNPRLMVTKDGRVAMTLHDHEKAGLVWLSGDKVGVTLEHSEIAWEAFDDMPGSITLWNKD